MTDNDHVEQKKESETLLDIWKRENPQYVKKKKKIRTLDVILALLFLGLCLIAYFYVIRPWQNIEKLDSVKVFDMILHYRQSIVYIWVIASFVILFALIDTFLTSFFLDDRRSCIKWLRTNKIDVNAAFRKDMPTLFPNGIDGKFTKEDLHDVYYGMFMNYKIGNILRISGFLGGVIAAIGLIIPLAVSLCNYIREVAGGETAELNFSIKPFIPVLVLMGVLLVYIIAFRVISDKKIKGYLRAKAKEVNASKKIG